MRCPASHDTDGATPFNWLIRPAQGPAWPEASLREIAVGESRTDMERDGSARTYGVNGWQPRRTSPAADIASTAPSGPAAMRLSDGPVVWRGGCPPDNRAQRPAGRGLSSGTSADSCRGSGRSPGRVRMIRVLAPVGAPRIRSPSGAAIACIPGLRARAGHQSVRSTTREQCGSSVSVVVSRCSPSSDDRAASSAVTVPPGRTSAAVIPGRASSVST